MDINPYSYTRPVTNESLFFGRWELVDKIISDLTEGNLSSSAIYGGRRSGKTSLLRMIEKKLKDRLSTDELPVVVPLYMDLQFDPLTSPSQFFEKLLSSLETWYLGLDSVSDKDIGLDFSIDSANPATGFADSFKNIYTRVQPVIGGVRLVILIDESENLNRPSWAHALEENLRALISNVPGVSGHLGLVMAGGIDFYWDMSKSEGGSPLRNVLDEEIILFPCSDESMKKLASIPIENQLSEELVNEIVKQAGGQLFLGQYLLHQLRELGIDSANLETIDEIKNHYFETRRDYEGWLKAIGNIGHKIFVYLAQQEEGVSFQETSRALDIRRLDTKKYLDILTFHNFIDKQDNKYFSRGQMSRDWFLNIFDEINDDDISDQAGGNVTNIFIGGNVEGSNIVSGDNNVITQQIQASFNKADEADIQAELKNTLKELAEAVAAMNKELPEEQATEAADDLEKLVEEATKPKPNKKWYSVSIDGLIKAAENLDKLGEPVISLSRKVLSLLTGGVIK
jgi:AAA+ ATPase superfamily predicted ATPase